MTAAIAARDLTKSYGSMRAVAGISFDVQPGEIFGLIGPDGAGKTTTFHMAAGILEPTSGEVSVFGRPAAASRLEVGYLTQQFSLYPDLSVDENLRYVAEVRLVPRNAFGERRDRYLALMGLEGIGERLARALSGGMKQKLALCCALIAEPRILLLDEPTTGVDPLSRREFWRIIAHLAETGVAVVIATPYLDEAERCHRLALMTEGSFRMTGTPEQLRGDHATLEDAFVAALGDEKVTDASEATFPALTTATPRQGAAIEIDGLVKRFGDFTAVDGVSLRVNYGEIYGLLGANGAGKTTIIKAICGLLTPTAGTVELAGRTRDLRSTELRRRIGYMSQKFTLYDDLTIGENLEFYAGVYRIPRQLRRAKIEWVLRTCDLSGREELLTSRLPGGWKQRLAFGASVMHEPAILFLDEPTSGVDPVARQELWRLIERFAAAGTAVVVTTHQLAEAEHCDRLCMLSAGRAIAQGSPSQIKAREPGTVYEVRAEPPELALQTIERVVAPWRASLFGRRIHVLLEDPRRETAAIRRALVERNVALEGIDAVATSLEDAFIALLHREVA